jgi:branched-chain amino acid transport system permease protein
MWNALAGYGGLISIGQQAFIGVGAYATIVLSHRGVPPYLAIVLAAAVGGALAVPISFLVLRLRGGQFAIGTWVVAEVLALLIALDPSVGGGTGVSLTGLNVYPPAERQAYTYWLALGFGVVLLGLIFALLRSPIGAALQAIRDDEEAAASLGVRVDASKRALFVLASFGCAAAGALILANTLFIQPQSIFGVQWTAYMIFMVLVGGLGTFEGPLIGAVVFFAIQHWFADRGAWYLIGLGTTAVGFALVLPRGLWGWAEQRLHVRLFPVGYQLDAGSRERGDRQAS